MIEEIFNNIIKNKTISFRGVKLGSDLAKLEKIEGSNFKKKIGSLSHYKYFYEVGDMEDLTIFYGFNPKDEKVEYIKVVLETYPKYYWKENGGTDAFEFITLLESNDLKKYSFTFDRVLEKLIIHFSNLLGEAKVETKDSVFNQPYHNFRSYFWIMEGCFFSITSYVDDKGRFDTATKRLHIELRKKK